MKTFKIARNYQYIIDSQSKKTIAIFNDFYNTGAEAVQNFCLGNRTLLKQYGFLISKWHNFCKKNQCLEKSLIVSTTCKEPDEYNEQIGRKIVKAKMDKKIDSLTYKFSEEICKEYCKLAYGMADSSYKANIRRECTTEHLNNLLDGLM